MFKKVKSDWFLVHMTIIERNPGFDYFGVLNFKINPLEAGLFDIGVSGADN